MSSIDAIIPQIMLALRIVTEHEYVMEELVLYHLRLPE
jgi:hypothetical protein